MRELLFPGRDRGGTLPRRRKINARPRRIADPDGRSATFAVGRKRESGPRPPSCAEGSEADTPPLVANWRASANSGHTMAASRVSALTPGKHCAPVHVPALHERLNYGHRPIRVGASKASDSRGHDCKKIRRFAHRISTLSKHDPATRQLPGRQRIFVGSFVLRGGLVGTFGRPIAVGLPPNALPIRKIYIMECAPCQRLP